MISDLLQRMYGQVKDAFLGPEREKVPAQFRSNFVNVGGAYETSYVVWRMLCRGGIEKGRVLVVGVYGGRDYYGLLLRGYDVHGFDLAPLPGFDKLSTGNVEDDLPYPDGHFDAVIVAEVIEHLREDARALTNLHRVLRNGGALVVTVPFLNDEPDYHLRVHTRASCQRLLESCGFEVAVVVERPGIWLPPPWMNHAHHLAGWLSLKLIGKLPHRVTLPWIARLEYALGQRAIGLRRYSRGYGGYFLCKQISKPTRDYLAINIEQFAEPG